MSSKRASPKRNPAARKSKPKQAAPRWLQGSATLGSLYDPKQNNFNIFRLIFASLVVFSHSFVLLLGPPHGDPLASHLLNGQMDAAGIGVEGFFAISGFLVTQSWLNSPGLDSFCLKRFLRIFPGYSVSIIFCILVILPLSGMPSLTYLGFWNAQVWTNVLTLGVFQGEIFLGGTFPKNPVAGVFNGALWTIPHETRCYLLVAALGLLGLLKSKGRWVAPLLLLGCMLWYQSLHTQELLHPGLNISGPARIITFFLAGMSAYLFRDYIPMNRPLLFLALVATGIGCYAGRMWLMPVFTTYLLFYAVTAKSLPFQNFGKTDLSYGVYLYGFPIQQILIFFHKAELTPMLLFLCTMTLACGLAFVSWKLIEAPALRLKRFAR